ESGEHVTDRAHKKGAALGQERLPSGKNTTVEGDIRVPKSSFQRTSFASRPGSQFRRRTWSFSQNRQTLPACHRTLSYSQLRDTLRLRSSSRRPSLRNGRAAPDWRFLRRGTGLGC